MTPHQVELVQHSLAEISPLSEEAGRIFYGRLFNIAPEVRPLFRGDLDEQAGKLVSMLSVVVADLNDMEHLLPLARQMAIRHVGYGVRPEHYQPVGEALVWMINEASEGELDDETTAAWRAAYSSLAHEMMAAAYDGETIS
ncbi:MAG: globin domain-containing protein [Hyphomicrobiaceae bacterium]